jgi:hypothetical protein
MIEVHIPTGDGKTVKTYAVHKFSPLDGREILAGYPLAILGKEHTYQNNAKAMRNLMRYCSILIGEGEGEQVHLVDDALINEHVPDWWTLVQLEYACLKHNCSFLEGTDLMSTVKASMTSMLTSLLQEQLEKYAK